MKTEIRKEQFLEIFKNTLCNITKACEKANITRQTFYVWCNSDRQFAEAIENIRESELDWAENQLKLKMAEKDTTAIIFFLKTKAKHRGYVERQEYQVQAVQNFDDFVAKINDGVDVKLIDDTEKLNQIENEK